MGEELIAFPEQDLDLNTFFDRVLQNIFDRENRCLQPERDIGLGQPIGAQISHQNVLFGKFIRKEIFPGGMLVVPEQIVRHAENAGFKVERRHSLREHYARTLDIWAANLEANHREAVELSSEQLYDRFMHYLTGCARHFRSGHIDVMQFTLVC